MSRIAASRRVTRIRVGGQTTSRAHFLSVEEPLEIRVEGQPLAVTMRTPGNDVELAHGFLVSEGIIHHREHILTARYCAGAVRGVGGNTTDSVGSVNGNECGTTPASPAAPIESDAFETKHGNTYNILDVALAPGVEPPSAEQARAFVSTSSCGLCGKASIDQVRTESEFEVDCDPLSIDAGMLASFPGVLRRGQAAFDRTGGLHAAALFNGNTGELLVLREDIGRHNAVDKVIGWALMQDILPARSCVLMVSSRASFEITQKAIMAGVPMLAAVSAASSLAVDLAREAGLTLVGFLRGDTMVAYSAPERVTNDGAGTCEAPDADTILIPEKQLATVGSKKAEQSLRRRHPRKTSRTRTSRSQNRKSLRLVLAG